MAVAATALPLAGGHAAGVIAREGVGWGLAKLAGTASDIETGAKFLRGEGTVMDAFGLGLGFAAGKAGDVVAAGGDKLIGNIIYTGGYGVIGLGLGNLPAPDSGGGGK